MQWGYSMNTAVFLAKGQKDPTKRNEDFIYVVPGMFYAVADGYWGRGRVASYLAPVLFHRKLEDRLALEQLTPATAHDFLQSCLNEANDELQDRTVHAYTTLSAAVIHEGQLYAFTLGDSVVFGYDGALHILTEPHTSLYTPSEIRGDSSAFEKYCVLDNGTQRPRNFMGLPSPDFSGEDKPTIRQLYIGSVDVYHSLLLATDGLTSLVLPEEIERACHEREPDKVIGKLESLWRNPEKIVYHLLAELYATADASAQQQVKVLIQQQGINPNQTPQQVYDALRQNIGAFQAVAKYCLNYPLNYPLRGSVRKPRDDTAVLYVELHPSQRPSVGVLCHQIAGLERQVASLQADVTVRTGETALLSSQLQSSTADYEKKLGELRGQLQAQTSRATKAESQISGLERSLAAETQRARQALEANRALQEQSSRTERGYAQELEQLREQLQQITSARTIAEQSLDQSRAQYSGLEVQLTGLRAENTAQLQRIAVLVEDNERYQSGNEGLRAQLSYVETELVGLRDATTVAEAARVAAETRLAEVEKNYEDLERLYLQLQGHEKIYLARITNLEARLSTLPTSQEPGPERKKPQKKSSWFSRIFKYSAIATVGVAAAGILSCGGLCYWIFSDHTPQEQYASQVEQVHQPVSPPVVAESVRRVEFVAPVQESVKTEEVPPAAPVNIIPPPSETVIEAPVFSWPTLDSLVQGLSLTVCVAKDGTMGYVVDPEKREAYAFQPTANEPDMNKKVTCNGELFVFDSSPEIHLFYVNGLTGNSLSDLRNNIFAASKNIGYQKYTLADILSEEVTQVKFCDSWSNKGGVTKSYACVDPNEFTVIDRVGFSGLFVGQNDRIIITQGGQE